MILLPGANLYSVRSVQKNRHFNGSQNLFVIPPALSINGYNLYPGRNSPADLASSSTWRSIHWPRPWNQCHDHKQCTIDCLVNCDRLNNFLSHWTIRPFHTKKKAYVCYCILLWPISTIAMRPWTDSNLRSGLKWPSVNGCLWCHCKYIATCQSKQLSV